MTITLADPEASAVAGAFRFLFRVQPSASCFSNSSTAIKSGSLAHWPTITVEWADCSLSWLRSFVTVPPDEQVVTDRNRHTLRSDCHMPACRVMPSDAGDQIAYLGLFRELTVARQILASTKPPPTREYEYSYSRVKCREYSQHSILVPLPTWTTEFKTIRDGNHVPVPLFDNIHLASTTQVSPMTSAGSFEPIHRLQARSAPSVPSDSAKRSPPSSKESRSPKRSRLPSPTQASQQVSVAVITQYEGTDVVPATIFKQPHWDDSAAEVLALKRIAVAKFISVTLTWDSKLDPGNLSFPDAAALRAALAAISDEKKKIFKGPAALGLPLKALVDTEQLPPFLLVVFIRRDSNSTVPDTPASAVLAQQIIPNDILNGAHSPVIKHGGEALPLEMQYEPFADTTRGLRRQLKDDKLLAEVQRLYGDSIDVNMMRASQNYGLVFGKPQKCSSGPSGRLPMTQLAEDPSPPITTRRRPGTGTPSAKDPDPDPAVKIVASEGLHGRLDLLPADGEVHKTDVDGLGVFQGLCLVFLDINAGFKGRAVQKFSLLHQTLQVDYFPTYPVVVLELWDHTLAIGYYYQRDSVFQYRDAHMPVVDLLVPGASGMPNDRHTSEVAYYFGVLRQLLNKIANHLKKKNPPHEYEPLVDDVLKVAIDGKPVQLQYVEAFRPDDPRIFKIRTVVMESPATERTTYYVAKLLSEQMSQKSFSPYMA
ncbi:hypothetical protein FB45DRAFT_876884 [Roridomyces roridus]|uniref:Uncharacterized protein n=1 Tax=Roridomyces roridus TaxID=1738132 RepID=A0AAD7FAZ2_9AGAR|nr:hypothetical protein FB45DRAFT_876884 [Roridomyces roridus]